jgi:hypothetical protein
MSILYTPNTLGLLQLCNMTSQASQLVQRVMNMMEYDGILSVATHALLLFFAHPLIASTSSQLHVPRDP